MKIRKWTKTVKLDDGESVETAAKSVGVFDDDGKRQKIVAGEKYVVSGDSGEYFVKPKPKKEKEVKNDQGY